MKIFYVYDNISLGSSYNEKRFRQKFYKKIKIHILRSTPFSESHAVFQIM